MQVVGAAARTKSARLAEGVAVCNAVIMLRHAHLVLQVFEQFDCRGNFGFLTGGIHWILALVCQ